VSERRNPPHQHGNYMATTELVCVASDEMVYDEFSSFSDVRGKYHHRNEMQIGLIVLISRTTGTS